MAHVKMCLRNLRFNPKVKNKLLFICTIIATLAPLLTSGSQSTTSGTPQTVLPPALLQQYCYSCHNQRVKSGGLALDQLDLTQVGRDAETWERVVRKLGAGMMPPPNAPRPDRQAYASFINWLRNELDRNAPEPTGLPALHRLNRTEYANAIRDLLGLKIDPGLYLPPDDSSRGFDNMAGTLGVSSTLVEAYVTAASAISRLAVGEPSTPQMVVYRAPADDTQNYHIEGLPFGTRGGIVVEHIFPSDGEYVLSTLPVMGDNGVTASFGSVSGEKLLVLLNGERVDLIDWGWRRGPDGEAVPMQVRFPAKAGPQTVGVTFPATNLAPLLDLDHQFMRSTLQTFRTPPELTFFPHVDSIRIEGPLNAVLPTDSAVRRRIFICEPSRSADEEACARQIITNLAMRAFRRPATAQEADSLMNFYRSARSQSDFSAGVRIALSHVLAAPQFIYRIQPNGAAAPINAFSFASRLSYFLWSAAPDEELLSAAGSGRLLEPAILEQQVRRMLKDPRSEALATNFAGQWLNLRSVQNVTPVPALYPNFDDPLRQAMRREVELFFDSIVREDRSVRELLNADYTFVNERLAQHYGIPNVTGSRFRRVTLGNNLDVRRGLLGKGAILSTTSAPDRTSPVMRGYWILNNLIGVPPPDPPPDIPDLPARAADLRGNAKEPTMREKMLAHRIRQDCIQCHQLMDPIGLTLEHFDAVGAWQTQDTTSSEVLYDGTRVNGVADLRRWLESRSDQITEVFSEKLLSYALGRGLDHKDMPVVRSIARDAARENDRFSAFVMAVVKSRTFQKGSNS